MCITTNEKYSCWALLGTQTFWTCSKLSYRPAEATRMRRTLFELIVIVIVIARMTKNDQEWSLEQTRIVNSSSFGSRFGSVGLGHYMCSGNCDDDHMNYLPWLLYMKLVLNMANLEYGYKLYNIIFRMNWDKGTEVITHSCECTQRRVQPDQCYFTVQITGSNFECSLWCNSTVIVCTVILHDGNY